jgi:ammonium transporter Rh
MTMPSYMGNPHGCGACQGVTYLAVPNIFRRILMSKLHRLFSALSGAILLSPLYASAQEAVATGAADAIRNVEQYNFSIHIMAMLLLGFGFLMVFVKKYGYSATTGTYLVVGAGIPLYMLLRSFGTISAEPVAADNVHALLLAEFGCASALIAMGAVLGRLRLYQYVLMVTIFIPLYMINEWLVMDGGLGFTKGFVDSAGSIIIHAFGAYCGLGLAVGISSAQHLEKTIESDETSDRFSMLGSMVLWIFWPSFCSAVVPSGQMQHTVINTILALCGATLMTYIASCIYRKGKVAIADIANASLAGGVAVGATCNVLSPASAFIVGLIAGLVCVTGYVVIQPALQKLLRSVDTCGVHNLHGMPGLVGGVTAVLVVPGVAKAQLLGIAFTVVFAFVSGCIGGYVLRLTGRKATIYEDKAFIGVE